MNFISYIPPSSEARDIEHIINNKNSSLLTQIAIPPNFQTSQTVQIELNPSQVSSTTLYNDYPCKECDNLQSSGKLISFQIIFHTLIIIRT
jgi:hypothetical protein